MLLGCSALPAQGRQPRGPGNGNSRPLIWEDFPGHSSFLELAVALPRTADDSLDLL